MRGATQGRIDGRVVVSLAFLRRVLVAISACKTNYFRPHYAMFLGLSSIASVGPFSLGESRKRSLSIPLCAVLVCTVLFSLGPSKAQASREADMLPELYGGLFIYGASIGAITLLYRAADVPHHRLLVPPALATAELLVGLSVYGLFSIAPDTMNIPFAYAVGASLLAYTLLLHGVISLLLYEPRRPDPSETFAFTLSPTVMPGEARTLRGLAATLHTRF